MSLNTFSSIISNWHGQNFDEGNLNFCFFADKVTSDAAELTHDRRKNIQVTGWDLYGIPRGRQGGLWDRTRFITALL